MSAVSFDKFFFRVTEETGNIRLAEPTVEP